MDVLERLRYRRQYILTPKLIDCPFIFNSYKLLGKYTLYAHVDLLVTGFNRNETKIILLGDIFDYEDTNKKNIDILYDLIDINFNKFLEKLSKYTGRFVLIYIVKNNLLMVHDATATRKIYFCKIKDYVWCASQPHLLAKTIGLKKTSNYSKQLFYNSKAFLSLNNSNIGDTTCYDEIRQVMPNHYLNINECRVIRYWPNKKIDNLSLNDTVQICSKMIKGYVESIGARYDIMLPVTAGKDSRTILAATYNIRNNVFYYINKEKHLKDISNDIKIPKKLFKKLKLDFHILNPYIPVDKNFKKIYYANNEYASSAYLPIIYNYYKYFSNKVNLPSNIATAGIWFYPIYKKSISAETLAGIINVKKFEYATEIYDKWLKSCREIYSLDNFLIMNLFYWEERLGNWGTQIQLDKDIAQDEINPFNSRQFIQYILGVKPIYIVDKADYFFTKKIIKYLWPETLQMPINPGFTNELLRIFKFLGILGMIFKIRYR